DIVADAVLSATFPRPSPRYARRHGDAAQHQPRQVGSDLPMFSVKFLLPLLLAPPPPGRAEHLVDPEHVGPNVETPELFQGPLDAAGLPQ
ncbi:MAG: hypothetical protein GXP62_01900, partial [Oligoflexia bacterium]|nr:hypothetical protein [Oligoflexia bacterium]